MRKKSDKIFDLDFCEASIKTFAGQRDSMLQNFRKGKEAGSKTYVRDIDQISSGGIQNKMWSWKAGEFNLWTGYNNEGKSQFLIFLCVLKAINEGWKFAFFSPENYPPDEFFDDIIHTILGKSTDRFYKNFDVSEQEYLKAFDMVKDSFYFVYPEKNGVPDFTIEQIESVFEFLVWEKDVKAVVVDPYIKIRHEMTAGEPEHLYASRFMMDRINFTRKNNVSYHLVMHQTTPRKEKDGNYPPPSLYQIKGGGTFADSTDNSISVWRPNRATDPNDTTVIIKTDKIKKQKLVGVPFEIEIDFNRKKNRYMGKDGFDYFENAKKVTGSEPVHEPRVEKFHRSGIEDFEFNQETITPF
jgi:twinkle protein